MKRKLFINCQFVGGTKRIEADGEKINLRKGFELFVVCNPITNCWSITELQSGLKIGDSGGTKKEAIEIARYRLAELSDDQIRRGIEAAITVNGILNPLPEKKA
jgi:hypothetical protein